VNKMPRKLNFETVPLAELISKGITARADSSRPKVLVVDDERIIADTLTAILRKNGFAAVAAYQGLDALEIALSIRPDLLLTDVSMPGMNGIELAIAVRQAVPSCRVLLFSGHSSTADMLARARESGHDFAVLAKPLHPTELLAQISQSLEVNTSV
jgi:CheY-like chemotaxis protein